MSKFSPGPWKAVSCGDSGCLWAKFVDADGALVFAPIHDDEPLFIDEADVPLVENATELYKAVEAFVANLDYLRNLWGDEGVTRSVADKGRAVLARINEGGPK